MGCCIFKANLNNLNVIYALFSLLVKILLFKSALGYALLKLIPAKTVSLVGKFYNNYLILIR